METNISLGKNDQESKFALKKKANTTMSLVLAIFYFGIIHNFKNMFFVCFNFVWISVRKHLIILFQVLVSRSISLHIFLNIEFEFSYNGTFPFQFI